MQLRGPSNAAGRAPEAAERASAVGEHALEATERASKAADRITKLAERTLEAAGMALGEWNGNKNEENEENRKIAFSGTIGHHLLWGPCPKNKAV